MKSSASYLKEIEALRRRHTHFFLANDWVRMQTIGKKIRDTWAAYHRAKEREESLTQKQEKVG